MLEQTLETAKFGELLGEFYSWLFSKCVIIFIITKRPILLLQESRSLRDKEVWQFTHEDIKNGIIHFVVSVEDSTKEPLGGALNDSFTYRLVAPGVQPAIGVFNFSVILQVSQKINSTVNLAEIFSHMQ